MTTSVYKYSVAPPWDYCLISLLTAESIRVTYFVESRESAEAAKKKGNVNSRGEYLLGLIGCEPVVRRLKQTQAAVSIAINEQEAKEDTAMIELMQGFNNARVPIDLWGNLPDSEGYWIYRDNIDVARREILEMINALEGRGVNIRNIGLDLEMKGPNPSDSKAEWNPDSSLDEAANKRLRSFIDEILKDRRYCVDTYELPILSDLEFVRRRLGIPRAPRISEVRNPNYRRVAMVYSTVYEKSMPRILRGFLFPTVDKFVQEYSFRRDRIPALGIVSASEENPGRGELDPRLLLRGRAFFRDIRAALVGSDKIYVFALNGPSVIDHTQAGIQAGICYAGFINR